ncbi:MAG: hypothetical protein M3N54_07700 [Acidobacteriota bacterium]|nr:hypothetical protein [Acidobacteriota bacterium]
MTCAICGIRKPRRFCPAVNGAICSICCGTGREETIDCPLECEYLQDAHDHEPLEPTDPATIPNSDLDLPDSFLEDNDALLVVLGSAVVEGARVSPGITDYDLREAFDSLARTYRTLQSGLHYETVPVNPYAAGVCEAVQGRIAELRKAAARAADGSMLTDSTVFGAMVVLQRLEYMHNNRRRRSRAFLDLLSRTYVPLPPDLSEMGPPPEEPRIIL